MKYFKRLGLYKASNVTFDPSTCTALSYDWWVFVKRIEGKVVFNGYRYSVSTAKHQRKVRTLLRELGIRIDLEVSFKVAQAVQDLENFERAEYRRIERNKRARENRAAKRLRESEQDALMQAQLEVPRD